MRRYWNIRSSAASRKRDDLVSHMRNRRRYLVPMILVSLLVVLAHSGEAQTADAPRCGTGVHESEATGTVFFPKDQIFCPLIADPKEVRSFVTLLRGTFPSLRDPSGEGVLIASVGLGDSFGLVRQGGPAAGEGVQLDVVGSIFAQFNLGTSSNDLINADYVIGVPLTVRRSGFSVRARLYHQSSHLGDEDPPEQRGCGTRESLVRIRGAAHLPGNTCHPSIRRRRAYFQAGAQHPLGQAVSRRVGVAHRTHAEDSIGGRCRSQNDGVPRLGARRQWTCGVGIRTAWTGRPSRTPYHAHAGAIRRPVTCTGNSLRRHLIRRRRLAFRAVTGLRAPDVYGTCPQGKPNPNLAGALAHAVREALRFCPPPCRSNKTIKSLRRKRPVKALTAAIRRELSCRSWRPHAPGDRRLPRSDTGWLCRGRWRLHSG